MKKYKLSDNTWSYKEIEAINRVIKSDRFTMGKEVKEYEKQFAEKIGSKYAVMSNSGSSANLLAIGALVYSGKLLSGDEVIVPAVSWSTTYFPVAQHNLKLRFVDIDADTYNIDVTKVESAITDRTKAILSVNLLGNPNEYKEILQICKKHNLILIEDSCESLGGKYKDKLLGTFGLLGTYSTFYSHHLCTMEGGVTVTNDEELYHYLLCIRAHGWTRNLPNDSKIYSKNNDDFYEQFNFIMPGYNLRPLEMEAAIGIEQLKKLDKIIEQRKKNARYFLKRIREVNNIKPQMEIEESSWFGFGMVIGENLDLRKCVVEALKKNDIEVRPIVAGNFTKNFAVKYLDYTIYKKLTNADIIHHNGLFVGNHSKNIREEIDILINVLKGVLNDR
ncbi:aminotransferase class V-fold PLP-dependent enzyme [Iocasia frigidifontis]|uniref:Aminotransferase class V-fold PLP-dependent enzyme n=1 Tax=Iocasia fonsfrigidae TaxID=2682810 RepID=A0A8A7KFQ2_9FIRM|nr:DegT/DnrJ/EryC1/StrS family aminotransferase [Iocasia fonsfrigidae]QTL97717.1 aminotransferase class V-fold PLP-dependent enzyme [Iocasia fonsfrigidae]